MQGSRATLLSATHTSPLQGTVAMAPSPNAPRMSQFVIALCVSLRASGKSLRQIAEHRLVKKRDGTQPKQQSVREALQTHRTARKSAKWTLNGAGKKNRGGRRKKISKAETKETEKRRRSRKRSEIGAGSDKCFLTPCEERRGVCLEKDPGKGTDKEEERKEEKRG